MSGAGASPAIGVGNAENDTPPQAVERSGAGKSVAGPRFSGPVHPVTNSISMGLYFKALNSIQLVYKLIKITRYHHNTQYYTYTYTLIFTCVAFGIRDTCLLYLLNIETVKLF